MLTFVGVMDKQGVSRGQVGRVGLELGANLAIPVQDLGFITQIGLFLERDGMN
jgi:hypothetical protein